MGLYWKCPRCQAKTPLYAKVCSWCGQSLENLPRSQRVSIIEPSAAALGKPVVPAAAKSPPPPRQGRQKAQGVPEENLRGPGQNPEKQLHQLRLSPGHRSHNVF
jgi:hypothetical protein